MGRGQRTLVNRGAALLVAGFSLTSSLFAAPGGYGRLPLSFEPAVESGVWAARGAGLNVTVTGAGANLRFGQANVGLRLAGGRTPNSVEPEQILPGRASYLLGNDRARWRTNLPTFGRLRIRHAYRGIDWVFYGNESQMEYDFVVAPGADPNQIRLRFTGISGIATMGDGSSRLSVPGGELIQKRPSLYQKIDGARHSVTGRFVPRGPREIAFAVGSYDRSKPLVIDPVLTYSTYVGAGATYQATAVTTDSSGNAYITGSTIGPRGDANIFVRKINPAGTALLYITTIGGAGDDIANAIAVDSSGAAFLTGQTLSNDLPVKNAFQPQTFGNTDAFLLRLDPTGTALLFSTYIGGSGQDRAFAIALDSQGNAYIAGDTTADFPTSTTQPPFQKGPFGGYDVFVARFDTTGNANYSTYFGGSLDEHAFAIALDAAGNAYITGSTQSANLPISTGAFQPGLGGVADAFVCEFNPTLSKVIYSTYLGGNDLDSGQGIAVDGAGNTYVAGSTSSNNFPAVTGSFRTSPLGGASDIFMTKLAPGGGTLIYSTFIGGHGDDFANALAVDGAGNAYITGSTTSADFPVTTDALELTRGRLSDAFVLGLNPSGTAVGYSTYFGGSGNETGQGIAVDGKGGVYVVGQTTSPDFPVSNGGAQPTYGGGATDAFVARFAIGGTEPSVNAGGIVNAASFVFAPIAPGSLFSIFGSNFVPTATSAASTPLPTTLGGYSIKVNGVAVPLIYAGPNQMNAQLPFEAAVSSSNTLTVTGVNGGSATSSFAVAQAAPGIFVYGSNHGVIQNNDDGSTNSATKPARAGRYIIVYYTGQGPLDHAVATGAATPASPVSTAKLKTTATIGGVTAPVYFAGMTPGFVGLAQANIQVPALQSADYPLVITVNGVPSNPAIVSVAQ